MSLEDYEITGSGMNVFSREESAVISILSPVD